MRRHFWISLIFAAGLVLRAADPLPTGEAILDKYIAVTGGKAAYEKIRTQITSAVMDFTGKGVKANMTMYHAEPVKSYSVVEIEGIGKMEEGTDGSIVWERSALKGPRIKTGEERAVSLRAANIQHDVRWRDYFTKVECTGIEPIDGRICIVPSRWSRLSTNQPAIPIAMIPMPPGLPRRSITIPSVC